MALPTEAEYDAAKQHQAGNAEAYAAADPSAEVLANVAVIREYEAELQRQLVESGGTP